MYIRLSKLWYTFFIMVAFFSLVFQVGIFCNTQVYCMFPPKCYFRWLNMAQPQSGIMNSQKGRKMMTKYIVDLNLAVEMYLTSH